MDEFLVLMGLLALTGLQLCVPECPNGEFERQMIEEMWTHNPLLRIFYGLTNLIGIAFTLLIIGYLTIAVHWWYLPATIVALIISKILSMILQLLLLPFYGLGNDITMFARVKVQRVTGCLMILSAVLCSSIFLL